MKTVVTGSTGRVGANLIKRLCDKGYDVTACLLPNDKHEAKLDGMKITKAYVNILDTAGLAEVIKGCDIVIHAAAVHESLLSKISNAEFYDINVKGMFNVLEGIRRNGQNTQLICLSSSAVYDIFTSGRTPIKENFERKPISLYGLTKILVEEQIRQYEWQYGIPSTILRPNYIIAGPEILDAFNFSVVFDVLFKYAGNNKAQFHTPDDPESWRAAKSSSTANSDNLCIPICPKGTSWQWHMTDVRDLIDLIDICLKNDKAYGKTFNIAGADLCDWRKVIPYIAEKTGRDVVEVNIPNLWQYAFDQSASKELLGFVPTYDHKNMVDIAIAMRNNEDVDIIPGETILSA